MSDEHRALAQAWWMTERYHGFEQLDEVFGAAREEVFDIMLEVRAGAASLLRELYGAAISTKERVVVAQEWAGYRNDAARSRIPDADA